MEGLTEGRIVHFVLPDGPHAGEHRPAIVVKVWRQGDGMPPTDGYSNLLVFVDGTNDGAAYAGCLRWETSVTHDLGCDRRTWHWIEKA
jgi:hypothetical protein